MYIHINIRYGDSNVQQTSWAHLTRQLVNYVHTSYIILSVSYIQAIWLVNYVHTYYWLVNYVHTYQLYTIG